MTRLLAGPVPEAIRWLPVGSPIYNRQVCPKLRSGVAGNAAFVSQGRGQTASCRTTADRLTLGETSNRHGSAIEGSPRSTPDFFRETGDGPEPFTP